MLAATVVVMSVMGCGDGVIACNPVESPKQVWSSQAACEEAIPGVLRKSLTMPYPVIAARCGAKDTKPADAALIAAATEGPFKAVRIEPAVSVLTAEEVAAMRAEPRSLTGRVVAGAKHGVERVGDGVSAAYGAARISAKLGYGALRDGVSVSLRATGQLTQKATDIVRGALN